MVSNHDGYSALIIRQWPSSHNDFACYPALVEVDRYPIALNFRSSYNLRYIKVPFLEPICFLDIYFKSRLSQDCELSDLFHNLEDIQLGLSTTYDQFCPISL